MHLAIETSSDFLSIVVSDKGVVLGEFQAVSPRTHAERLVPGIRTVLSNSGYTVDQIDTIAVNVGPGSYTGLRIGLATAKGYAMAKNLDVVGVSSFEGLAAGTRFSSGTTYVMIPARENEWYTGIVKDAVTFSQPVKSGIATPGDVARSIALEPAPVHIVTPNPEKLQKDSGGQLKNIQVVDVQPHARFISTVATVRIDANQFSSLHDLEPDYGREYVAAVPSDVFRKLESRMLKD